jgi:putative MATE family efflux protein
MSDQVESLTEGPLVRPMGKLMAPIIVMGLLQTSYNLIDTFWLGRLSTTAIAAISIAFPVIFLIISLGSGFLVAGSTLVAQQMGSDNPVRAGEAAGQTITVAGVASVTLGFVGFLAARPLFSLVPAQGATAADVLPLAVNFMRVFFLGLPTLFLFSAFSVVMRGYGDTRTPMLVMAITILINLVLDPILIFGWLGAPALGIAGAATATVIARGVGAAVGLYILFRMDIGLNVRLTDLVPTREGVAEIVRIGVPSSLEDASTSLAIALVAFFVTTFSPAVVAAYGIGTRILAFVQMIGGAFGQTTNTTVGQNLGADNQDRAKRSIWIAGGSVIVTMVGIGLLTAVFAEPIVRVFLTEGTPRTQAAIDHSVTFLRVLAIGFAFSGVFETVLGAYRGAGNTQTALGFSLLSLWIGRIMVIIYLTEVAGFGPLGIWIGMIASSVIGSLASVVWLTRETWTEAVVADVGAD